MTHLAINKMAAGGNMLGISVLIESILNYSLTKSFQHPVIDNVLHEVDILIVTLKRGNMIEKKIVSEDSEELFS